MSAGDAPDTREVVGFTTDTLEVFDITDPLSVTRMVSTTVVESGSYSLKFEDTIGGEHHYFALRPSQYKSPPPILEDAPSSLADTSNGADYIIITHSDFRDAVVPLRDHREGQGLGTFVADVQDVYDEFSYGIFDPRAIRDFFEICLRQLGGPTAQLRLAGWRRQLRFQESPRAG